MKSSPKSTDNTINMSVQLQLPQSTNKVEKTDEKPQIHAHASVSTGKSQNSLSMEPMNKQTNTENSIEEYRQAAEELHFISEDLDGEDGLDHVQGSGFDSSTSIGELTSKDSLNNVVFQNCSEMKKGRASC